MMNVSHFLLVIASLIFLSCQPDAREEVYIHFPADSPQVHFAVQKIKEATLRMGLTFSEKESTNSDVQPNVLMIYANDTATLKNYNFKLPDQLAPEGFSIQVKAGKYAIIAVDDAGLMYGGLEFAEQLEISGLTGVKPTDRNPYMALRGVKFNIPLDARTPTYSDPGDAAQKNITEMWNLDFWKEYIDNLALHRYNFISLWSLQPFPSLVKTPGYEDVALNDVHRSSIQWKENYDLEATGLDAPEILANPEIVKTISIDEKIIFWQKVMAYGKERNIDFFFITWNIFVNGTDGKYGITDAISNPMTKDYYRKSVKQMFLTYPDLAGIGLTTGENMKDASFEEKEDWAFDTYALGTLDAALEMPDRNFTFVHRQHMAGARDIEEKFSILQEQKNMEFLFSFKYAQAHVMSATQQPFHEKFVNEIGDMKTIWTLRNDDNYYFRWGAPDFVREFIKNIPHDISKGYYYGSDQWVWGREFTMKDADSPRQLEIAKHWYHWMMWGRLGYDPSMDNDRFAAILASRFSEVDAKQLFKAWQEASMVYPTTTGFHWGALDFQWYIEACKSRPAFAQNETGFHDVNRFINLPPHPKSGFQSIPEYVKMTIDGGKSDLLPPAEVAKKLHSHADAALQIIDSWADVESDELRYTINDIRTMAYLGKYYAYKIEGSLQLALYRASNDIKHQEAAIEKLDHALKVWKKYTESAMKQNINPIWTNRVGYVDWMKITDWVAADIAIAKAG